MQINEFSKQSKFGTTFNNTRMGSELKEATVRSNIKNFVQRKLCSVYGYECVCV